MPRGRPRKLLISGVVTPGDLSKTVIERYIKEAATNLATWRKSYEDNINKYAGDRARQALAQTKLATWYDIYVTEVYPKVKDAYATARTEYIKKVIKPLGGGIARPPV
jgi:hypothetical protein